MWPEPNQPAVPFNEPSWPRNPNPDTDRGQAFGLILIAIALIATTAIAVGLVGARFHDRSTAQSAADAAALAGAIDGQDAASAVAARNGADLVAYSETRTGADVTVSVEVIVDGESAIARASTAP